MRLPLQTQAIPRNDSFTVNRHRLTPSNTGLQLQCAGIPNSIVGTCFDSNGPVPGRFNCSACCALRGAISWQGGGYAVAC